MHRGEQSHRVGLKYWLTANNVLLLCISRQYVNSLRTRFSGSTVKKNPFQASHDVHNNASQHTWEAWEAKMRTNVVIDDDLMESALKLSGLKTKKDAIEEGLKLLVLVKSQEAIRAFRGKLKWSSNLDEMRLDK
jgi:Arc/MetJ family transcription regulator